MTAARSFQMAAKANATPDDEHKPVSFTLTDANGKDRTLTATYPGDGAIILVAATAAGTDVGAEALNEIFAFIKESFSAADSAFIRSKFRSAEISPELLMDIIGDLMESWTSFPTQPPSASSPKRPSTGTKSTASSAPKG